MKKAILIFFLMAQAGTAFCGENIEQEWKSDKVTYLVGYFTVKYLEIDWSECDKFEQNDDRKFQCVINHSAQLHLAVDPLIENKTQEGDFALVKVLELNVGGGPLDRILTEIIHRGKKMLPIIKYAAEHQAACFTVCKSKDGVCRDEKLRKELLAECVRGIHEGKYKENELE